MFVSFQNMYVRFPILIYSTQKVEKRHYSHLREHHLEANEGSEKEEEEEEGIGRD
jgi:hypothetical protein